MTKLDEFLKLNPRARLPLTKRWNFSEYGLGSNISKADALEELHARGWEVRSGIAVWNKRKDEYEYPPHLCDPHSNTVLDLNKTEYAYIQFLGGAK